MQLKAEQYDQVIETIGKLLVYEPGNEEAEEIKKQAETEIAKDKERVSKRRIAKKDRNKAFSTSFTNFIMNSYCVS